MIELTYLPPVSTWVIWSVFFLHLYFGNKWHRFIYWLDVLCVTDQQYQSSEGKHTADSNQASSFLHLPLDF